MSRKRIEKNLAYDDKKELFYAYFDYGIDANGRRKRATKTFVDMKDAKVALLTFEVDKLQGNLTQPSRITVAEWLNYWLEDVIKPNREYTTYYYNQSMIKNHVSPALGDTLLQKLTPYQIQQYYTRMIRDKGLSPNTVHKHHVMLNTALKLAYRQGVIPENPVCKVDPPRKVPPRQFYYTPAQLKRLFQLTEGTWLETVVKLGGYLGLRRGEICGLRWENIDLKEMVIYVRTTRTTVGKATIEKAPKTAHSVRTLGIGGLDDLIDLLRRNRLEQLRWQKEIGERYHDSGYVLTHNDGSPRRPNEVTQALQTFVKNHQLPPITVHGLRHTFASVANSAHIPMVDIGKALGHKDISITGRIYTHLFDCTYKEVFDSVATQIATS